MSTRRQVLDIALPAMATNIATALFGMADIAVIGRLGDAAAQGAVEMGAKLLMAALIVFNFLRTGTIALAAQAAGRGSEAEQTATLARALAAALAIGLVFLLTRPLAETWGLSLLGARGRLDSLAQSYVAIRYWGGPIWLVNAVLSGWLIARKRLSAIMGVEIGSNMVHVALDLTFVLGLNLGVAGVATATLLSETVKGLLLAGLVARERPALLAAVRDRLTWRGAELMALFRMNRDLLGRTALLMAVNLIVTRFGAEQGPVVLAANAILLQFFTLSALFLDGFESSAQVLCGEALGGRDRHAFDRAARISLRFGFLAAAFASAVFLLGARPIAALFSTDPQVVATAGTYALWAAVLPLAEVASFVLDGVFIGAAWTRAMLLTMAAALAVFVAALWLARPLGNHGLWLAFALFFVARAGGQLIAAPGLARRSFTLAHS
jgi:multidrug resistance protein, MATE family